MDEPEKIWRALMNQIASVPEAERAEAMLAYFAMALEVMEDSQIAKARAELTSIFGEDHELVEVLDGQVALRAIKRSS